MMDTWRYAPGFSHERLDRRKALTFLVNETDPKAVSAFQLARGPAEESDFLRLCLLYHYGGVYADADDVLMGGLPELLSSGGLVVYLERGGDLGNNFIAAPPQHPAVGYGLEMAQQALIARDSECAWGKTGPGLWTRAVAQYLADAGTEEVGTEAAGTGEAGNGEASAASAGSDLTIWRMEDILRRISMHNPTVNKRSETYWNAAAYHRPTPLADRVRRYLGDVEATSQTA
jgi:hypothetical protein